MHVAIDFDKGTATLTTSEFWSGLSDLLVEADAHPIDSRDDDSVAYRIDQHLVVGKPLWPLIERDIDADASLKAKLSHACEIRSAGSGLGPPTADNHGRAYVWIGSLRAGCRVQFDGELGCMPDQAVRQVKCDANGELYVECNCGKHHLVDDQGVVVGVYPMNRAIPDGSRLKLVDGGAD